MAWSKLKRAEHMLKQYHQKMAEYRAWLGGACVMCGSTERLEFDHIKRHWKQFTIAKGWMKPKQIVYNELMVCQLLCQDCHKLKTYN